MSEKTLHNSDVSGARVNVPDVALPSLVEDGKLLDGMERFVRGDEMGFSIVLDDEPLIPGGDCRVVVYAEASVAPIGIGPTVRDALRSALSGKAER